MATTRELISKGCLNLVRLGGRACGLSMVRDFRDQGFQRAGNVEAFGGESRREI